MDICKGRKQDLLNQMIGAFCFYSLRKYELQSSKGGKNERKY